MKSFLFPWRDAIYRRRIGDKIERKQKNNITNVRNDVGLQTRTYTTFLCLSHEEREDVIVRTV